MPDGRKRTAMYFGRVSPGCILSWYSEIKQQLASDGFTVTHLGLGTKSRFGRISQTKRTEKRYTEAVKENPDEVISFDVYCIEEDVTYLSTRYLIHMMLLTNRMEKKNPLCVELVFDFSVLDRVDIQKYMDITKRFIGWDKEFVFDCGKSDFPLNFALSYTYSKNSKGYSENFKEFKLIREETAVN